MNNTKHTPGPWNVNPDFVCDVQADGVKISTAWSVDEIGCVLKVPNIPMPTPEEQEANARLIAAAPEMLETLKDTYELQFEGVSNERWILEVIRKADPDYKK